MVRRLPSGNLAAPHIRILSDLHFGDERSRLRALTALAPLLAGVDQLVLNGDCCHTQAGAVPGEIAALKEHFAARVPQVVYLTGNHDPDISATHELSLADGRVWVTHGDILFDTLAPWSRLRGRIAGNLARIRQKHPPDDWQRIPTRLLMFREACLGLPCENLPVLHGAPQRFLRLLRDLFPPHRALSMLHTWAVAPGRAARLAAAQRPEAQVVVMGHVHFPAVSRRAGRTIVNTGSFCPPLGALLVDLIGEQVQVRQVEFRAAAFHPGKTVAEISLRSPPPIPEADQNRPWPDPPSFTSPGAGSG